jgi:hypothetical protein
MFILEHSVEILYYYNMVVASGLLIGQEFGILFLSHPPNPPHPPPLKPLFFFGRWVWEAKEGTLFSS